MWSQLLCRFSASIPVEGKRCEAKGLEEVKRDEGGVCSVSSTVAQSANSEEDNSSRPPLTAIGCGREDTLWAAGSHHLQNQQCYRAAWRHCTPRGAQWAAEVIVAHLLLRLFCFLNSYRATRAGPVVHPEVVEPLLIYGPIGSGDNSLRSIDLYIHIYICVWVWVCLSLSIYILH